MLIQDYLDICDPVLTFDFRGVGSVRFWRPDCCKDSMSDPEKLNRHGISRVPTGKPVGLSSGSPE